MLNTFLVSDTKILFFAYKVMVKFPFSIIRGHGSSSSKMTFRFSYELKPEDGGVCIVNLLKGRRNKMCGKPQIAESI